ncbi:MAG: hypothetical protein HY355_05955 [Armatimonadetes bacterium]|nr:hypothetical protein [Armatimonadota bacterium]
MRGVMAIGTMCLAVLLAWAVVPLAYGFTVDEVFDNGTPNDPSDDLLQVARWSHVPQSLVGDRVRGLGGGLEYAATPDYCARILPRFIDTPAPTCDRLQEAIQRAFSRWSASHPVLRFPDVSGRIAPTLPPAGHPRPWEGFGAEIDLFALREDEFARVRGFAAYTGFWYVFAQPRGTNGRLLPGGTLTSADIVFNTTAPTCYHLDPTLAGRGCNHFESLLLHEIGHALVLDHPNEFPHRNFDSDNDPTNVIPIDCQDPARGLRPSSNLDARAVMNSSRGRPEPVHAGLTNDDLGGRNFLYPICPGAHRPEPRKTGAAADAPLTAWLIFVGAGLPWVRGKRPHRSSGRKPPPVWHGGGKPHSPVHGPW